jgi:hypothetical protein
MNGLEKHDDSGDREYRRKVNKKLANIERDLISVEGEFAMAAEEVKTESPPFMLRVPDDDGQEANGGDGEGNVRAGLEEYGPVRPADQ